MHWDDRDLELGEIWLAKIKVGFFFSIIYLGIELK